MKRKILIVDDDEMLCEELAEILTGEDYSVDTAFDGQKGLAAARKARYDLILLDIKMPRMNGFEFLQELKRGATTSKVLVLSANHSVNAFLGDTVDIPEDYSQKILALAEGVMNKPYDVEVLLSRIRTLLAEPRVS